MKKLTALILCIAVIFSAFTSFANENYHPIILFPEELRTDETVQEIHNRFGENVTFVNCHLSHFTERVNLCMAAGEDAIIIGPINDKTIQFAEEQTFPHGDFINGLKYIIIE